MRLRVWAHAVGLALILCAGSPLFAADPDTVTLNFVNADIDGVVKAIADITGKNFALDPRVKGTVNIVSARPMSRALVYDVFLSALRLQGFAAVEEGGIVKIVPEADAKLESGSTVGPHDRSRAHGDEVQTRVFVLRYESASQLVPVLRPLIAPNNVVNAYPGSNTLVITDYASNLRRIEKIIDAIDVPSGTDAAVIPLHYASALDVAQTVNRLFPEPSQAAGAPDGVQRMVVVADARSNSLLARSDNPARLSQLRAVVAALDSSSSATGNIHVVYLRNAEAVKVADTLRAIYQGESGSVPHPASGSGSGSAGGYSATPAASMSTASGTSQPQTPATTPLAQSSISSSPASSSAVASIIQADAATNSIIINAPDAIYNNLRAALDKLDVRRAQVYVEALIAEITSDKAAEFGIQWQDLSGAVSTNGAHAFGGTNFGTPSQNILSIAQNPASAGQGLNIGVIKGTVTIPGIGQVLNLGLLVRALESDSTANILSTPTLLTLDNEEARIVVGQNVPFITGQYALSGAATTPTPFQTVERQDVGLTLRIKPQILQGGAVRLQLYQEVSSVQDTTNPAGVITNKRSIESTVMVDNGQIIVIGGLIQDTVSDGTNKVPVVGDLPLVGGLFRYNTRSRTKTNLMVFLRPTVLRDTAAAGPLTNDRYDYIIGEQQKTEPAPSAALPAIPTPTLPALTAPALTQPAEPAGSAPGAGGPGGAPGAR
jgi:general secretion pathway protein D